MESVSLCIDGKAIAAESGQTVLEAALAHGIAIPHLCYDPRITPTGACRLCLVEIEGLAALQTACTLRVQAGMTVRTNTEDIHALRKATLELLLSEHNFTCPTCDKDGECLLQNYAYKYQIKEARYPSVALAADGDNYTRGNKAIVYDASKCVRCQRCVKICDEVQMAHALTFKGRAGSVEVATGFDVDLYDSPCEVCGQCIGTCPTGALYERGAVGQGKAKDMRRVRTTCPYCGVGCQMDLNVSVETGRIVRVTCPPNTVPNGGNLCVKGRFGMDFAGNSDRLAVPLIRENGGFREASWDEALDLVASRFRAIKEQYGSEALAGLSSAKTTNEDNYVMQKFVRVVFGTNNVDHCARLCHASSVAGLARSFGSGAMTNSIEELRRTPLIFVIGSNTTECHPVIGILIRQAAASGNTTLIVADPRRISLTEIAHLHMRHRPGTDVALINGMMKAILDEGVENRDFIVERTEGFEELREVLAAWSVEQSAAITGVSAEKIRRAARLYASAPSAAIVYSMGITQHTTGTDNVMSLANLALLTGNVGRECSGVNPLRGQNNVQGSCDMGALPNVYPGYQAVDDPAAQAKFERAWNVSLSRAPGLTVVEIMNAAAEGKIRGLYAMGENPMLSDPDLGHVEEGLKSLEFFVVQDIFLTETARLADVVLPAWSFAEKEGTFTNTERRVLRVRKAVEPPGQARDDWQILCEVATRMGYPMAYAGASAIMEEIAALTPSYGGITYERIEKIGLQWPCPTRDHPGTKVLHMQSFPRGKGKFHPVRFIAARELPDAEYPFLLTTGRLLEHWHTGTMTRRCEVLDDRVPHGAIELNPDDARTLGVSNGDRVFVASRRGRIELPADVTERVPPGTVFLAFHFREHAANVLTIAALDPIAKIPEYKVCAVQLSKA